MRLPYINQSARAYNGRTLDEQVVNPFLRQNRIPSSAGPFLGVFRRSVKFTSETRNGLRDKSGFDSFLSLLSYLERTESQDLHDVFIPYLLHQFLLLREGAQIPLLRLQRLSLEQYRRFLSDLLATASGGRLPVLIVVAMLRSFSETFDLDWSVQLQGINVADAASGAGGDISVTQNGRVVLAAEVTERPVDRSRVLSTFQEKLRQAVLSNTYSLSVYRRSTRVPSRRHSSSLHKATKSTC